MKPRIEFNDQKFDGHNTKKGGIASIGIGLRWERDQNHASAELRYKRKRWRRSKKTKLLITLLIIFCVKNTRLSILWKGERVLTQSSLEQV